MNQPSSQMDRFARAWHDAAEVAEPAFDEEQSLSRFLDAQRSGAHLRRRRARIWAMAAAALVVLAVGGATLLRPAWMGAGGAPEPGAWVETGASEQFPLQFSEGSEVVVEGRSRVRVASVDPRGARMVLERGNVSANIAHRADTRWSFEAGPFTVKVTGTKLRVGWDPATEHFDVAVESGSVVVSGPLLEQGRAVRGGQRCSVQVKQAHLEVARVGPAPEPSRGVEVTDLPLLAPSAEPEASSATNPAAASVPSWLALERAGKYREALAAAEQVGFASITGSGSPADLMALARAARHAGRGGVSSQALRACRERFPGSTQAATAAFLLGRGAGPAAAAGWFLTYLREQPSGSLAREAAGRLVESYQRSGNLAAASDAARSYLRSYPSGPHAAFARSVLAEQGE